MWWCRVSRNTQRSFVILGVVLSQWILPLGTSHCYGEERELTLNVKRSRVHLSSQTPFFFAEGDLSLTSGRALIEASSKKVRALSLTLSPTFRSLKATPSSQLPLLEALVSQIPSNPVVVASTTIAPERADGSFIATVKVKSGNDTGISKVTFMRSKDSSDLKLRVKKAFDLQEVEIPTGNAEVEGEFLFEAS
jgi:hypothetical protein